MLALRVRDFSSTHDQLGALTPTERDKYMNFLFGARKQSYLAGRLAAKEAVQMAHPDRDLKDIEVSNSDNPENRGAPVVNTGGTLSVTHGNGLSAAIYSTDKKCGLDIEIVKSRSEAFQAEACNGEELKVMSTLQEEAKAVGSTLLWTAKEAMSKVVEKGLSLSTRKMGVGLSGPGVQEWLLDPAGSLELTGWIGNRENKFGLISQMIERAGERFVLSLSWKL